MIDVPWGQAACLGCDMDVWFAQGVSKQADADRAEAKATCQRCPIREGCLDAALVEEKGLGPDSRHGIRGGKTGKQRHSIARWRTERQRAA
ncbi:WhiB family transcriptional regulator [[Kitasatospora] papulosa]|uniref:WhiB family transcriptional regulator n=1 Tax=Streptomyces TaxID=1883 RepID=UPI003329BCE4